MWKLDGTRQELRRKAKEPHAREAIERWVAVRELILTKEWDVDRMETELQFVAPDDVGKARRAATEEILGNLKKELEALHMELPSVEAACSTAVR